MNKLVSQMGQNSKNQNLLQSWKEIASYLDYGVRTCIRWEQKFDLPVHRMEGMPRTRVFAYKDELDKWLEEKLANNSPARKSESKSLTNRKWLMLVLSTLAIAAAITIILVIRQPTAISPQKKPTSSKVPKSTGPLTFGNHDIVTTEFSGVGTLRVWRKDEHNSYQDIWNINPVRHSSVAIGNLDSESDLEIVAPGVCREEELRGERKVSFYKYWINVYKHGVDDWWQTTFYSKENCVFEQDNFEHTEIAVGDVDGFPGNEVILETTTCLAIFKYEENTDEFKLLRSRYSFFDDRDLFIKSVAVANIDRDPTAEIIIAADEVKDKAIVPNKGWILILKLQKDSLEITKSIEIDGSPGYQSLRIGDVIDGGFPEIIAPIYRNTNEMWNTHILGWTAQGEKVIDKQVFKIADVHMRMIHLDVGDLTPQAGDEIAMGHGTPDEVKYYFWTGTQLIEGSMYSLGYGKVAITNVYIVDSDGRPDSFGEVVVVGTGWLEEEEAQSGKFYLEVFGYSDGFYSKWHELGGEEGMIRASYAAIGKSKK